MYYWVHSHQNKIPFFGKKTQASWLRMKNFPGYFSSITFILSGRFFGDEMGARSSQMVFSLHVCLFARLWMCVYYICILFQDIAAFLSTPTSGDRDGSVAWSSYDEISTPPQSNLAYPKLGQGELRLPRSSIYGYISFYFSVPLVLSLIMLV